MTDLLAVTYSEVDALAFCAVAQARACLVGIEEDVPPCLATADRTVALRVIASILQGWLFAARAAADLDAVLYAIAGRLDGVPAPGRRDDGAAVALARAQNGLLALSTTLARIAGLMQAGAERDHHRAAA